MVKFKTKSGKVISFKAKGEKKKKKTVRAMAKKKGSRSRRYYKAKSRKKPKSVWRASHMAAAGYDAYVLLKAEEGRDNLLHLKNTITGAGAGRGTEFNSFLQGLGGNAKNHIVDMAAVTIGVPIVGKFLRKFIRPVRIYTGRKNVLVSH